jgi:hypothetical protein
MLILHGVRARLAVPAFALLCSGCFSPIFHPEYRSAIEQQMISEAIERCVESLELPGTDPRAAYALRIAAPTGVDTALIRARLEQRLAEAQIRVQPEKTPPRKPSRTPTLVAVVAYAGMDAEATLIGIPFIVPGIPVALGDISLYKSSTLTGRARVELSAWSANHEKVGTAPPSEASRYYRNFTVLTFIGPFRSSNLDERPLPGDEP